MLNTIAGVPAADTEPARAPGAFEELVREIGHDGACEVLAVFWDDTDARLKRFRELALDQHRARIAREAHSLKGSARTFGYRRLAALALQLETSVEVLTDADYCNLMDRVDAAYAAALELEPAR
ncbi:Hpt domain-containing protein [Bradyrhizobium liaoningense]|uniref:Hpt domain-containing protein n=1 Tax=Bradyrhizobium liaoningense TaxID=43992 RepID=UPI001BAD204C|nr:Hpt domain-containing protein [Bradyrhizobium liaoningense]MBR0716915.1 Hpt domain-containing protein [Bradyrhizobium liaoningense]